MSKSEIVGDDMTLDVIETLSWRLLQEGADGQSDPFRFPVLATRSEHGVDARVLVLRRVDRDRRTLEFHTDRRSAKIRQLAANPDMTWVFYDPQFKLQLRVTGAGALCDDSNLIKARWNDLSPHTQKAYAQELPPGLPVDSIRNGAPCAHVEDPQTGRENFAVVECRMSQIEWLLLSRRGHQRAVFEYLDGRWSSSWLMP